MRRASHPHAHEPQRVRAATTSGLPLFAAPNASGHVQQGGSPDRLARRADPEPSHDAATRIRGQLTPLQERVLGAVRELGPIDAAALEQLPRFSDCAPSTVRKRLSELFGAGRIRAHDTIKRQGRSTITRWEVVT